MTTRPRNRLLGAIRALVAPPSIDSASSLASVTTGYRLDAGRTGRARAPGVRRLGGVPVLFLRLGTGAAVYGSDRSNGEIFAPMIVGQTILFCDRLEESCYAYDVPSRARRWKFRLPTRDSDERALVGEPAIDDGAIFLGTTSGIFALELATGALRWKNALATSIAVAADARVVYAADGRGVVHALSARDGSEAWKVAIDAPIVSAMACSPDGIFVQTATHVIALDRAGGKRWEAATKAPTWHVAVRPALSFDDGTLYAAGDAGLRAYDASNGTVRWRFEEATPRAAIAISAGKLFVSASIEELGEVGSGDAVERASLFALEAASGRVKWRAPLDNYLRSAPVVAGDVVYLFEALRGRADPFRLHAFDAAEGRELWSYADFAVSSEPVAASGCVLYGTNKGVVKAIW